MDGDIQIINILIIMDSGSSGTSMTELGNSSDDRGPVFYTLSTPGAHSLPKVPWLACIALFNNYII